MGSFSVVCLATYEDLEMSNVQCPLCELRLLLQLTTILILKKKLTTIFGIPTSILVLVSRGCLDS